MIHLEATRNRDRILIIEDGKLNPNLPFSRDSTGMYLNGSNTIVSAATNVPRFEYSALSLYMGLLLEEARTNLLLNSDGTVAQLNVSSGVSDAASPLATYFTNSIQFPQGHSATIYGVKFATVTQGLTYTLSVFLKMDDGSAPVVSASSGSGDISMVLFNGIVAGVATHIGGNVYRVSATGTAPASASTHFAVYSYTNQTRKGLRVSGYQLELASTRTSYIPTAGSTVTRSVDAAQATLSTIGISTTQGTFVIEHDVPSGQPLLYSGSNVILDSSGGTKVAIGYDGSGWSKSVNGAAVTTSGTALTFSTTLDVGKSSTTSANGHIRRVTWYKTKRANSELQALST